MADDERNRSDAEIGGSQAANLVTGAISDDGVDGRRARVLLGRPCGMADSRATTAGMELQAPHETHPSAIVALAAPEYTRPESRQ